MIKVSVILPTYNEKGNIIPLIEKLITTLEGSSIKKFELLVIDDNSDDGTPQAVEEFVKSDDRVKLTVRKKERGLATAVRTGIELSRGEIIVLMDTDFNHNPRDVKRLIEPIGGYDIVVGSRYIKGGFIEYSWIRHYLSYFFNMFLRLYLEIQTRDNLSGFIAVKREIFREMDMNLIFRGFGEYHIRFIYWSYLKGHKILEIPVIYNKRAYGKSKFKFLEYLITYTKVAFHTKKTIFHS
jgi:dolichol-phosphate mannosyltransferase